MHADTDTRPRGGRLVILAICYLLIVVEGFDISAMGIAAPRVAAELHLDARQMGFILSASMFGMLLGALALGRIADLVGRRPALVASVLGMGVFTFATTWSASYVAFCMARLAAGLALGGALPNLIAVAAETIPGRYRTAVISFLFSAMSIGGFVCGAIAHGPAAQADWRFIFEVGGVLPVLLAPLLFWIIPAGRGTAPSGRSATMAWGMALFGEGRKPGTLALWAMGAMTLIIFYLMLNWLPSFVVMKGLAPSAAATAIMAFNAGNLVGAVLIGMLIYRLGFRWAMVGTYVALAACVVLFGRAAALPQILLYAGLSGIFVNAAQAAVYGASAQHFPPAARASGAGSVVAAARTGAIIGPLFAGLLIAAGFSLQTVLTMTVPCLACAALAAILFAARPAPAG